MILANVVGSKDEAKKKIYPVFSTIYTGFGALIIKKLSHKVKGGESESEIVTEGSSVVRGDHCQDGSGPLKVDSAAEVLHERVPKQIIKEGHGPKPSKYSTCFLTYWCKDREPPQNFSSTFDSLEISTRFVLMIIFSSFDFKFCIVLNYCIYFGFNI